MTAFEYLSVALSLVVGLSVTRLLGSGVHLFVDRERVRADWVSIAWAVLCFFWQLQFWWAIFELSSLPHWTFGGFLLLVLSPVLLFAASALVLPHRAVELGVDLRAHFGSHGRWGVLFLMAYFLSAFALGPVLWGPAVFFAPDNAPLHALNLTTVALGIATFAARGRRLQVWTTSLSIVIQTFMYFVSVPWAY